MTAIMLNLVVIRSPGIERAADFYRALGVPLTSHRHGKGPTHYAAELGTVVFEIYPRKSETDSTASVRLGFRVASVDDAVTAVQEAGGQVVAAPQLSEWGRRAVVEDPDGHRIELTE